MIGSTTLLITFQEFQQLLNLPHPVLCYNSLTMNWFTAYTKKDLNEAVFEKLKVRILKQDYRHYLGEVVDLKEYNIGGDTVSYCGNTFQLVEHSGSFHLWNISNGGVKSVISYTKSECKQWLCDHFTALFKKDLPHLNIKFIWS